MTTFYNILFSLLLGLHIGFSQPAIDAEMKPYNWETPTNAKFETFEGKQTLLLDGKATLKNVTFTNGTIQVDVYANTKRSFAGIFFRKQNQTMEEVYMRLHKSNQVDAVQYSPTFNSELTWQLYREHQAQFTFKQKGWNTLRLEIKNGALTVFVNNEKVLTVENMKTDFYEGSIGLFSLFPNRFTNFSYTPDTKNYKINLNNAKFLNTSFITNWEITPARLYNEADFKLKDELFKNTMTVNTDETGLLAISKYLDKSSSGNFEKNDEMYTVASTTIEASRKQSKRLYFDYSDKVIVYLNGSPIFKGNNAFRSKGVQFMGHLNVETNSLYLPLKTGKNLIQFVVIDKANGWGLISKLD